MALDDVQKRRVTRLGTRILDALAAVARAAAERIGGVRPHAPADSLAFVDNPMAHERQAGIHSLAVIQHEDRQQLERLVREPFVASVKVTWEADPPKEEVFYFSRASAAGIGDVVDDGRLVTYRSPLGRLAEFRPGERVFALGRAGTIRERVRLRPAISAREWDALDDTIDLPEFSVALESVRRFLEQVGWPLESGEVRDILAELFGQAAESRLVRDKLRRQVVSRIALRDQPILDRYQGEVFRMPVDRRLVLLGPPGTGKTTTLIR